jgi:hypothetical protein
MIIQLPDERIAFVAVIAYPEEEDREPEAVVASAMYNMFKLKCDEYEILDPLQHREAYKAGMEEVIKLLKAEDVEWSYADEELVIIDTAKVITDLRRTMRRVVRLLVMTEAQLKGMKDVTARDRGERVETQASSSSRGTNGKGGN